MDVRKLPKPPLGLHTSTYPNHRNSVEHLCLFQPKALVISTVAGQMLLKEKKTPGIASSDFDAMGF